MRAYKPIFFAFRPTDRNFHALPSRFYLAKTTNTLPDKYGDSSFILLEGQSRPESYSRYQFVVDDRRGGAIVLVRSVFEGEDPSSPSLEIEHIHDATVGWIPSKWTALGDIKSLVAVVDYRINEPVDDDQFELTFPAGSFVFDRRDENRYLVNEDGSLRRVSLRAALSSKLRAGHPPEPSNDRT